MMRAQRVRATLERWAALVLVRWRPVAAKRMGEMSYWRSRLAAEGKLSGDHYPRMFTDAFGLDAESFQGASILDLGCGPRGSLEWADAAALRLGLDPLARLYRQLGTRRHAMRYIAASSEAMPIAADSLDVVASLNSLDHVDDLPGTVREVARVLKPGGRFLVMVDINHQPTLLEPLSLDWELPDRLEPLRAEWVRHLERVPGGMAPSVKRGTAFDHGNPTPRPGILVGRFVKP